MSIKIKIIENLSQENLSQENLGQDYCLGQNIKVYRVIAQNNNRFNILAWGDLTFNEDKWDSIPNRDKWYIHAPKEIEYHYVNWPQEGF